MSMYEINKFQTIKHKKPQQSMLETQNLLITRLEWVGTSPDTDFEGTEAVEEATLTRLARFLEF